MTQGRSPLTSQSTIHECGLSAAALFLCNTAQPRTELTHLRSNRDVSEAPLPRQPRCTCCAPDSISRTVLASTDAGNGLLKKRMFGFPPSIGDEPSA